MNLHNYPETTAYVSITRQSWKLGQIEGEVQVATYQWEFQWCFRQRQLMVKPSLGRALIKEPLERFLERSDYKLEAGSNYTFTLRSRL